MRRIILSIIPIVLFCASSVALILSHNIKPINLIICPDQIKLSITVSYEFTNKTKDVRLTGYCK